MDLNIVEICHMEAIIVEDLERRSPSLESSSPSPIAPHAIKAHVEDISKGKEVKSQGEKFSIEKEHTQ